jgi:hypothetical protein
MEENMKSVQQTLLVKLAALARFLSQVRVLLVLIITCIIQLNVLLVIVMFVLLIFLFLAGPEAKMSEVVPPRFIEALKPQIVAEGEVVIMETHVESHPVCSFQWFQHSVPVKVSDLYFYKYILESVWYVTGGFA